MESLYSQYIKERTFDSILETSEGFATYRFVHTTGGNKAVYIVDIYTVPELRNSGVAKRFADEIVKEAKEKGCNELFGTVVPSTKNSTISMKVLIAYGMTVSGTGNDVVVFRKEI